jgi:hypothetical protein
MLGANNPQLKEFEQLSERAIDLIFNNVRINLHIENQCEKCI